jgi:transposase InsO family protein
MIFRSPDGPESSASAGEASTTCRAHLALMRRIDELHLEYSFAGSRMLRDLLAGEGIIDGRLHVATLMKRMATKAIYRRPNTSKPAPGHKIYPYLLRKLPVTRPNQVWAMDITPVMGPKGRGSDPHTPAALNQHPRNIPQPRRIYAATQTGYRR